MKNSAITLLITACCITAHASIRLPPITMNYEDKVGIWKCPYHNSRACIEISNRIKSLTK